MNASLRARLSNRMVGEICTDRCEIHRCTGTDDGRGGQTLTWAKVAEVVARFTNQSDSEAQPGGGIEPVADWTLITSIAVVVEPRDRVFMVGDRTRFWEVVGSDAGQTDLLIQHISMLERRS
jgi:hypothetical protein